MTLIVLVFIFIISFVLNFLLKKLYNVDVISIYERATEKSKKKTKVVSVIDTLLDLNILIRLRIDNPKIIEYIENIIDKLRTTTPTLLETYSKNELTWVVGKIASKYLPNVLYPYSKLSVEQQIVKEDALVESLESIDNELNEIISMVNKKDESQFDKKAKFIKHRFSDKF